MVIPAFVLKRLHSTFRTDTRYNASVLLLAGLVLLAAACDRQPDSNVRIMTTTAVSRDHKWVVQWGEKDKEELLFVAFEGVPPETTAVSGLVTAHGPFRKPAYGIVHAPGGDIRVPDKRFLFEKVDGQYRESDEKISLQEFKDFLKSQPTRYTIEALLAFSQAARNGRVPD